MKKAFTYFAIAGSASVSLSVASLANADVKRIAGSDTLYGLMSDAIMQAGLEDQLQYTGGGSGAGEKAMVEGTQAIAGSSRPYKPEAIAKAKAAGIQLTGHVIALDGIAVWINKGNAASQADLTTVKKIFTCEITDWSNVAGSGRTGAIKVYRRNDSSGTTDLFKSILKIEKFGSCVTEVAETADIAELTSKDVAAIGFAGLSAGTLKNRPLQLANPGSAIGFLPTVSNIRAGNYPLSRKIYVYEASGASKPTAPEAALLDKLLDRSFMDQIVQANEFFTLD